MKNISIIFDGEKVLSLTESEDVRDTDIAQEIFDLSHDDFFSEGSIHFFPRPMVVGDQVEIDGKIYLCDHFGWKEV